MSDHHSKHASQHSNSIIEDLHKSDKGITTEAPINDSILRHSAPALLARSRFTLFSSADKLRTSIDMPHHPRRNVGMPHLIRS